jgi:hypothetical protein
LDTPKTPDREIVPPQTTVSLSPQSPRGDTRAAPEDARAPHTDSSTKARGALGAHPRAVAERRAAVRQPAVTASFEIDGERLVERGSLASEARAPAADAGASESASWRPWLAGATPREVLARIVHEDPLRLRARVAAALREGAYLLDADQVHLRGLALVARHAARYRGRPEFSQWLDGLVADAVQSILREEAEREWGLDSAVRVPREASPTSTRGESLRTARGDSALADRRRPNASNHAENEAVTETAVPGAFLALARPLGLEPAAMGRACAAFNRLPLAERAAFFALVIQARSLDDLARESGEGATDIARRARRALDAILNVSAAQREASPDAEPEAPRPASGAGCRAEEVNS